LYHPIGKVQALFVLVLTFFLISRRIAVGDGMTPTMNVEACGFYLATARAAKNGKKGWEKSGSPL
jgi:hypothetical protein